MFELKISRDWTLWGLFLGGLLPGAGKCYRPSFSKSVVARECLRCQILVGYCPTFLITRYIFFSVEGCHGDCLCVWVASASLVLWSQPRGGGDQPQGRHRPLHHRGEKRSGWDLLYYLFIIKILADCNKYSWDLKTYKNYTQDFFQSPCCLSSSEIYNPSSLFSGSHRPSSGEENIIFGLTTILFTLFTILTSNVHRLNWN